MTIFYLKPDDVPSGLPENVDWEEHIRISKDSQVYSLEDFVVAFNEDRISDQGYIALGRETESEH